MSATPLHDQDYLSQLARVDGSRRPRGKTVRGTTSARGNVHIGGIRAGGPQTGTRERPATPVFEQADQAPLPSEQAAARSPTPPSSSPMSSRMRAYPQSAQVRIRVDEEEDEEEEDAEEDQPQGMPTERMDGGSGSSDSASPERLSSGRGGRLRGRVSTPESSMEVLTAQAAEPAVFAAAARTTVGPAANRMASPRKRRRAGSVASPDGSPARQGRKWHAEPAMAQDRAAAGQRSLSGQGDAQDRGRARRGNDPSTSYGAKIQGAGPFSRQRCKPVGFPRKTEGQDKDAERYEQWRVPKTAEEQTFSSPTASKEKGNIGGTKPAPDPQMDLNNTRERFLACMKVV